MEKRGRRGRKPSVAYSLQSGVSGLACQVLYCGRSFENPVELERHHVFHLEQEFKDIDKVRIRRVRGERGEVGSKLRRLRSETYSRLKERRERRRLLSSSLGQPGITVCQVCCENIEGSLEDHCQHVKSCLQVPRTVENSEEEYVYVEDYEEYEWAGQSRIRVNTLLSGGLAGAGFLTIQRTDETEELDVTGEEVELGPEQYNENSLVQASRQEDEDKLDQSYSGSSTDIPETISKNSQPLSENTLPKPKQDVNKVEKLKSEISRLEAVTRELQDMSTCRVCLDKYVRHVVSTACWHVHCEACWLLTLASKKLCPQCKTIVKPSDLRRIYL
ncbi:E3 ubiquitin-protein ligase Rnf220 [Eurytemora carolleeae]|uniref:E3 ubiquitin-protein ligase Rnf220 n=1 Tax=Eurytemora carolleeae TaxID=1294199 RepID=UPI000C77576B|nr:E3 ubiquitin-protein ligase Rnf220 [Eurytemora carolleeae]|eukprot:XP_023329508.1 E3 ubiquitin-protein ligase Rnf220-like [Eurytemora affinis]